MLSTISTAFAHTRCISPSVCLLKSFIQASTFAPSPFSARASAIRSRTCGRQRLAFLAVSATGGARKPNPSEGGEGAPAPRAEINCFGKEDSNERNPSGVSFVFVQVAFALQRRGEGAPAPCSDLIAAAKPHFTLRQVRCRKFRQRSPKNRKTPPKGDNINESNTA